MNDACAIGSRRPAIGYSTARLRLRELHHDDAGFIHALVNDPDWLRHIGDRGVRTLDDARGYIDNGPRAMYGAHGHGLLAVETRGGGRPIGLCGLLRRETLDDPDLGFAFLPDWRGRGYALEAAAATLAWARSQRGLRRVVAITSQDNAASGRLLEKIGFAYERDVRLAADAEPLRLYGAAI